MVISSFKFCVLVDFHTAVSSVIITTVSHVLITVAALSVSLLVTAPLLRPTGREGSPQTMGGLSGSARCLAASVSGKIHRSSLLTTEMVRSANAAPPIAATAGSAQSEFKLNGSTILSTAIDPPLPPQHFVFSSDERPEAEPQLCTTAPSPTRLCSSAAVSELDPDRSPDASFLCVVIDWRPSLGLEKNYESRYGNIGVLFLRWISVCAPLWIANIIVSPRHSFYYALDIAAEPSQQGFYGAKLHSSNIRLLVTAGPIVQECCVARFDHDYLTAATLSHYAVSSIDGSSQSPPFENRWYSTDTCFGLNQNHLWSLNEPIIIKLSHQSSSEASCLSMVCRRTSVQRVHLARSRDVKIKLPLFVHPSHVHLVSSGNFEVGVRAVHARSTSFQTLPFGQINVACDYSMLVVVAYSGTHPLLPTVRHLSSKTLLLALLSLVLVFLFYDVLPTVEDPSGYYLVTIEHSSGCNRLNSF